MFADWPLATVRHNSKSIKRINRHRRIATTGLTADMRRGFKPSSHLRVHGDHHLLLLAHQGVALLDLLDDPILEGITEDNRENVDEPLLGHLWKVDIIRKIHGDDRFVGGVLEDLLDGEILVLRDMDCLHLVVVHIRLTPSENVLQEVDREVVY